MTEGPWRPGMPTRCGSCLGKDLEYGSEGDATCRSCGAVTHRWKGSAASLLKTSPGTRDVSRGPRAEPVEERSSVRTAASPWTPAESKAIERANRGVGLLIVGALLAWIPVIGGIGIAVAGVGAAFLVIGRGPFRFEHLRFVVIGIGLAGAALLVALLTTFILSSTIVAALATTSATAGVTEALESAFGTMLLGGIGVAALLGLAATLWTYDLQDRKGKILLWVSLAANVLVAIGVFALVSGDVSGAVALAFEDGTYDPVPIDQLRSQVSFLGSLTFFPAMLYSWAYLRARSRIEDRKVPRPREEAAAPEPQSSAA